MGFLRDSIIYVLTKDRSDVSTVLKIMGMDGGAGSGNFGHSGRPGKRGGSSKRGGGGGVSKERSKEIKVARAAFKKMNRDEKMKALKKVGQIPVSGNKFDDDVVKEYADKHKMSVDKYLDWRAARYFTLKKFQKEPEYKTPMKPKEPQGRYSYESKERFNYIKEHTGCNDDIVGKMKRGLEDHFGSASAECEWPDRFIDSDSRYEGAIYRWKHYAGDKAKKVVEGLVPGAKIQNSHETNWSFSSDPWKTAHFGAYNERFKDADEITVRYTCDRNITASPVQCLSSFDNAECEVIPHSKTSWTISDVEVMEMPNGGLMYDVHMVEDDWHEEKGIPVWKPTGNELEGGWKDDFPKELSGAQNVFDGIGQSSADMSAFMEKTPAGSEFYKVTDDKVLFIRKDEFDWYVADITEKFNESMNESLENGFFLNDWTNEDMDIWDKVKGTEIAKPITKSKAKELMMGDDVMMMKLGESGEKFGSEEINHTLHGMKVGKFEGDIEDYFDSLPEGVKLHDDINNITLVKNKNNEWDYIDPQTGEVVTSYDNSDMKTLANENPYYDLSVVGMETPNETGESKKEEEKKTEPTGYEDIEEMTQKIRDFNNGSEEECKEWLSGCPVGTVIEKDGYGDFTYKGNGEWNYFSQEKGKNFNVSSEDLAFYVVYQLTPYEAKYIPYVSEPKSSGKESSGKETKSSAETKMESFKKMSDESGCEKWVKGLKKGTKFQQTLPNGNKGVTLVSDGDGEWTVAKADGEGADKTDAGFVAWCLVQKDLNFHCEELHNDGEDGFAEDGGPGSGNFNHEGRPGLVGGSGKGEGSGGGSSGKASVTKMSAKEFVAKQKESFSKMDNKQKMQFLVDNGVIKSGFDMISSLGTTKETKGLKPSQYMNMLAEKYFAIEENKPHFGTLEYKTPMKEARPQESYISNSEMKLKKIQQENGVSETIARRMLVGLDSHFDDGTVVDPWIDRYIDSDGHYEGAIYRWKAYRSGTEEAEDKLSKLVPGAKIENKHGSNWSFSSDPEATNGFGRVHKGDYESVCFICEKNKTAAPVQAFSSFDDDECEVIPHSQTSWTVQRVEKVPKPNGDGFIHKVYMTEDDWHEEKNIPVWKPEDYVPEVSGKSSNFADLGEAKESFQYAKGDEKDMAKFLKDAPANTQFIWNEKGWTFTKNDDGSWTKETAHSEMYISEDEVVDYAIDGTSYLWSYRTEQQISVKPPPKDYKEANKIFEHINNGDVGETKESLLSMPAGTQFYDEDYDATYTKQTNGSWKMEKKSGSAELEMEYNNDNLASTMIDKQSFNLEYLPLKPDNANDADDIMAQLKGEPQKFKKFVDSLPDGSEFMGFGSNLGIWKKQKDGWYFLDLAGKSVDNPLMMWKWYGDNAKKVPDNSETTKSLLGTMCVKLGRGE